MLHQLLPCVLNLMPLTNSGMVSKVSAPAEGVVQRGLIAVCRAAGRSKALRNKAGADRQWP
jgi:hypothetical protein